jgi:hypothetical protein
MKRPIDRYIVEKLKEIYGFTISDEEIDRNVTDFKRAHDGDKVVLVINYRHQLMYLSPLITSN